MSDFILRVLLTGFPGTSEKWDLTGCKFSRGHTLLSLALVEVQNKGRVGCRQKNVWKAGGSDNDEMRMITASFARAIERFAGDLCLHLLP